MTAGTVYRRFGKRCCDIFAAAIGLVLLSPVLLIVAVLVRWRLGSPVLFKQQRPGKDDRLFRMVKFRSMTDACDENGELLSDGIRLTRFGRFLRKTSLDELPELWNVLLGQMSLVGPRPLLPEYLNRYTETQSRRHEVRPGITGWAQINGRNTLEWEKRFELDVWYVDHHSFWLDLKILLLTVWRVIRPRGVSAEGHATMPRFGETEWQTDQVAVIGAGGHAKVVIDTLRAAGFSPGGIFDDDASLRGTRILDVPIVAGLEQLAELSGQPAVIAIGDNAARAEIAGRFDLDWQTIVHPEAVVADDVELGAGTVVMAGAVIQTGTRVGRHAIINTASSVDHDSAIGNFVHLAPGARLAGNVTCGVGAFCGTGSVVVPGVDIGAWSVLGAGSTAIASISDHTTAVGSPARVVSEPTPLRRAA